MPQAAVIVPSFGRPDALKSCVEALVQQDISDLEIVIVDDGSPQPLEPFCAPYDNVRCIRQENSGPAAARNRGAREATADFIAFTDDDCRPRPDWVAKLMDAHAGEENRLVGGRVENGFPENPYATASQDICDFLYEWFGAAEGKMPFFTSNNIGCTRSKFLEMGGFDQSFPLAAAEDREFGIRWRDTFGDLIYSEHAVVDHYHPLTLRRFWRQHRNYGLGARHLHKVLEDQGSDIPKREPLAFYVDLVTHSVRRKGLSGVSGSALSVLSQMAMVAGYASGAKK